jgi:hypothetical protein
MDRLIIITLLSFLVMPVLAESDSQGIPNSIVNDPSYSTYKKDIDELMSSTAYKRLKEHSDKKNAGNEESIKTTKNNEEQSKVTESKDYLISYGGLSKEEYYEILEKIQKNTKKRGERMRSSNSVYFYPKRNISSGFYPQILKINHYQPTKK